jgi:hypothetical protein
VLRPTTTTPSRAAIRVCGAARSRLAAATNGRQVRFDPNGERHYLDEAEIASQVSQAQQDVQKYCN